MSDQSSVEELERRAATAQAAASRARKAANEQRRREIEEREERLAQFDQAFVQKAGERARLHAEQVRQAEDRLRSAILETEFGRAYVELRRLHRLGYLVGVETVSRRTALGLDPGLMPVLLAEPFLLDQMEELLESEAANLADEELDAMQAERQAAAERSS